MSKWKKVIVTQQVKIKVDKSKFTDEFMEEFSRYFYDFQTIDDHIKNLARVYLQNGELPAFIEGYGDPNEYGIEVTNGPCEIESYQETAAVSETDRDIEQLVADLKRIAIQDCNNSEFNAMEDHLCGMAAETMEQLATRLKRIEEDKEILREVAQVVVDHLERHNSPKACEQARSLINTAANNRERDDE